MEEEDELLEVPEQALQEAVKEVVEEALEEALEKALEVVLEEKKGYYGLIDYESNMLRFPMINNPSFSCIWSPMCVTLTGWKFKI